MKLVPMKFGDYSWLHNPRKVSFECEKNVSELANVLEKPTVQILGRKNVLVKGEGQLFGDDCMEQFAELLSVFKNSGCERLSIPKMPGIYAVFESLEILGEPKPDVLDYGFLFREVSEKQAEVRQRYVYAEVGECLWDISYDSCVSIDNLVSLNPDVKYPDEDISGMRVRLC